MKKIILVTAESLLILLALLLVCTSLVSALTASIDNTKMIIKASQGTTIEKYILVKNINDVDVNIELSVSSSLRKVITLQERYFTLAPGSGKKAYFEIDIPDLKTKEGTIDILFSPGSGEKDVLISSTISIFPQPPQEKKNIKSTTSEIQDSKKETSINDKNINNKNQFILTGSLTTILILLALFFLLVLSSYKKRVKEDKGIK